MWTSRKVIVTADELGPPCKKNLTEWKGKNNLLRRIDMYMPITDAAKKQIAQQRRLFFKVCFKCGGRNPISANRCRKCRGSQLRLKNRTLGAKK